MTKDALIRDARDRIDRMYRATDSRPLKKRLAQLDTMLAQRQAGQIVDGDPIELAEEIADLCSELTGQDLVRAILDTFPSSKVCTQAQQPKRSSLWDIPKEHGGYAN